MSTYDQFGTMNPVQQLYGDTCAIKSQQLILQDFGFNLTEDELVDISMQHQWYKGDGTGTAMGNIGKLLELNGIPVTQMENANVYTLVGELARGHEIIVAVDSDELWNKGIKTSLQDMFVGDTPDHALLVSGIDTTDPEHVKVVVTDPGNGNIYQSYDLDDFIDAWQDSNCFMVSTDIPAPLEYNPEMIHFNYEEGHLADIGNMSFEQFEQQILPLSEALPHHPEAFQQFFDDFKSLQDMSEPTMGFSSFNFDAALEISNEHLDQWSGHADSPMDDLTEMNDFDHTSSLSYEM